MQNTRRNDTHNPPTDLTVERGAPSDLNEVALLYDALNDYLAAHINYPGWKKGVYPTRADAEAGIQDGCLFVARTRGRICATFILRGDPVAGYELVNWRGESDYRKIRVVHTLAVHPDWLGRGIGERLFSYIFSYARENGVREIRLDTYEKNIPAIRLYEKCGFAYVGAVDLGYAQYGLFLYRLYKKSLY